MSYLRDDSMGEDSYSPSFVRMGIGVPNPDPSSVRMVIGKWV